MRRGLPIGDTPVGHSLFEGEDVWLSGVDQVSGGEERRRKEEVEVSISKEEIEGLHLQHDGLLHEAMKEEICVVHRVVHAAWTAALACNGKCTASQNSCPWSTQLPH